MWRRNGESGAEIDELTGAYRRYILLNVLKSTANWQKSRSWSKNDFCSSFSKSHPLRANFVCSTNFVCVELLTVVFVYLFIINRMYITVKEKSFCQAVGLQNDFSL
jgi:hypothetical protein